MLKLTNKELTSEEGTFGPYGLDYESLNNKALKDWLDRAVALVNSIIGYIDDENLVFPDKMEEHMGYVPYALGDISNFLFDCSRVLGKEIKKS